MDKDLALRILGGIMAWEDSQATEEFNWLRLMSRMKYDGYQDYLAGARFIESLVYWIQQFKTSQERVDAYQFLRKHLVFIGTAEILRLVELLYPEEVQRTLVKAVAAKLNIPQYRVWASTEASNAYKQLLRRTLFVGLSDGARLDQFRRANAGVINNEQIIVTTHIDDEKWDDLLNELRQSPGQPRDARFEVVYLIDDFVGTGMTFIRKDEDTSEWKGKLAKFYKAVDTRLTNDFHPKVRICVHHYIANHRAMKNLRECQDAALSECGPCQWFRNVEFSFGMTLPENFPIITSNDAAAKAFVDLARQYYDPDLETKHTRKGKTDMQFGFSKCALPLILEHNTPNNSVSLLWAETEGKAEKAHAMRPLFRRRQRHT